MSTAPAICPRCGTRLDPKLVKARILMHPCCQGNWPPLPPRQHRRRPGLRVIDGSKTPARLVCEAWQCKTHAARWADGSHVHGTYCTKHARMMIPQNKWADAGVPAADPEPARRVKPAAGAGAAALDWAGQG